MDRGLVSEQMEPSLIESDGNEAEDADGDVVPDTSLQPVDIA
jgi:hypothetical protein